MSLADDPQVTFFKVYGFQDLLGFQVSGMGMGLNTQTLTRKVGYERVKMYDFLKENIHLILLISLVQINI
jgi:hypothetical protein